MPFAGGQPRAVTPMADQRATRWGGTSGPKGQWVIFVRFKVGIHCADAYWMAPHSHNLPVSHPRRGIADSGLLTRMARLDS